MRLSRAIPEHVKHQVRRRCGFGCIRCGSLIVQYHHFDPPFEQATEHRAEGITLLCGGCHDEVTRGLISGDTIREINAQPVCVREDAHHRLDLVRPIVAVAGTVMFVGQGPLVIVGNKPLFEIVVDDDGSVLINAVFVDDLGSPLLEIRRSELLVRRGSWDARFVGQRLVVRRAPGDIALDMSVQPRHSVHVRNLNLRHRNLHVCCNSNGITVTQYGNVSNILSPGGVLVTQGALRLERNRCTIGPASAFIPYPLIRFRKFVDEGSIDALAQELCAPKIHVNAPRFAADSWRIGKGDGTELAVASTRSEAVEKAQEIAAGIPAARIVVAEQSGQITFIFEDGEFSSPSMKLSGLNS